VSSDPRFNPSSFNCTPTTPTLSVALTAMVMVSATVTPAAGEVIETVGGVVSSKFVSTCAGTLTRKASNRLVPTLLVQMKYWPVTSRLPFGSLEYASPPPVAFMSVITGATTKTRKEPSKRKHTTSLTRGPFVLSAPLPHAYCCSGRRVGFAFAWLTCWTEWGSPWGSSYTTVPGPRGD